MGNEPLNRLIVSANEAAVLFGLKPSTIRQWKHRGHIAAIAYLGRTPLFKASDINRLFRERMPNRQEKNSYADD